MALTVLVIDDNRLIANSLAQMVEVLGHRAGTAFGSMAGMQVLNRLQPDVILMDIHMQGLNGIDFCRMIRQNAAADRPVIIMISTDNQPQMIDNARAAGASGFLPKPITIDDLEAVLGQVESMLS